MSAMEDILNAVPVPRMLRVRQRFPGKQADFEAGAFEEQFNAHLQRSSVKTGDRIGLAVGSRGIENLPEIVGVIGRALQGVGAKPFLIPAMGSHGHATAEGQAEVLRSFGLD